MRRIGSWALAGPDVNPVWLDFMHTLLQQLPRGPARELGAYESRRLYNALAKMDRRHGLDTMIAAPNMAPREA